MKLLSRHNAVSEFSSGLGRWPDVGQREKNARTPESSPDFSALVQNERDDDDAHLEFYDPMM